MKVPFEEYAVEKARVYCPPMKEKVLLIQIASHAQPNGAGCCAALPTLASEVGRNERTVRRWLRELEMMGLVETEMGGVFPGVASRYWLPFCCHTAEELRYFCRPTGGYLPIPFPKSVLGKEYAIRGYEKVLSFIMKPKDNPGQSAPHPGQFVRGPRTNTSETPDKLPPQHEGNINTTTGFARSLQLEKLGVKIKQSEYAVPEWQLPRPVLTKDPLDILAEVNESLAAELRRARDARDWHREEIEGGGLVAEAEREFLKTRLSESD